MEALSEIILIIEGPLRFKVVSKFSTVLVNYFKTLEGRFYDFQAQMWSFPLEALEGFKAFLEERYFESKTVQLDKFLTIYKTNKELQLKFGSYQESFAILQEFEGGKYDRCISMYVIPIKHEEPLEIVLKENGYAYQVVKKATNDGQTHVKEVGKDEEPISKRQKIA